MQILRATVYNNFKWSFTKNRVLNFFQQRNCPPAEKTP